MHGSRPWEHSFTSPDVTQHCCCSKPVLFLRLTGRKPLLQHCRLAALCHRSYIWKPRTCALAKAQNGGENEVGSTLEQDIAGSPVEQKFAGIADNWSEAGSSGNRVKGSSSAVTPARQDRSSGAAQWQGPPQRSYHRNGRHTAGSVPRSASTSTSDRQNESREPSSGRFESGEDNKQAGNRRSLDSRRTEKRGGNGRGFEGRQGQKEGGPGYGHGSRLQSRADGGGNAKYGWRGRVEGKPGSVDSRLGEGREGGTETLCEVTPAERVWIAWQPLKRKLDGRYPLTKNQVNVFAKLILEINAAEEAIAGDFFSTSMHRLALLRTKQHPRNSVFTDSCYEAFQTLLRRVGSGSLELNCRSIAMVVWSVARMAKAEGWRLPRRRSAAAAAAAATPTADAGQQRLETADDDVGWEDEPVRSRSHPQEGARPDTGSTVIAPETREAAQEAAQEAAEPAERPEALSESSSADQGNTKEAQDSERRASNAGAGASRQAPGMELQRPVRKPKSVPSRSPRRQEQQQLRRHQQLPEEIYSYLDSLAKTWLSRQKKATAGPLCNLLWSFASLGYSPLEGRLFRSVQWRALQVLWLMNNQDMSNLLWAYGQLREEMDEQLLESLAQRLIANRKELRPITIPLTLMACARLGKSPASGRLFDRLLEEILFRGQQHGPKRLTAESMTSLIEAAAMVHHPVQEHVIDRWAVNCLNRHKEYRDWEQETIVWASRELNLNPLKGRLLATLYMMNPALEQLVVLRETTNLPGGSSEA